MRISRASVLLWAPLFLKLVGPDIQYKPLDAGHELYADRFNPRHILSVTDNGFGQNHFYDTDGDRILDRRVSLSIHRYGVIGQEIAIEQNPTVFAEANLAYQKSR